MKKMVLVDPSSILLKTSPVPDTLSESIIKLDDDIKRVLESPYLKDYDKALAYQQTLYQYLNRINKTKNTQLNNSSELSLPAKEKDNSEEKIIQLENRLVKSLPKNLRKKGELLLDHLKQTTDLKWNYKGELIYKDSTLENTNLTDLFHTTIRNRKSSKLPHGWSTFVNILKESNIPSDLIGNQTQFDQNIQENHFTTSPDDYITPIDKRLRKRQRNLLSSDNQQNTPKKNKKNARQRWSSYT